MFVLILNISIKIKTGFFNTSILHMQFTPLLKKILARTLNVVSRFLVFPSGTRGPTSTENQIRPVDSDSAHQCESSISGSIVWERKLTSLCLAISMAVCGSSRTSRVALTNVIYTFFPFYNTRNVLDLFCFLTFLEKFDPKFSHI